MAESLVHLRLVEGIITYLEHAYRHSHGLAILHDLPGLIRAEKPPRIGGYVPDVYAIDTPQSIAIIGEAKTQGDLETDHSRKQLVAFLRFLTLQSSGVLVLAVPWAVSTSARNLIRRLQIEGCYKAVQSVVIDDTTMAGLC